MTIGPLGNKWSQGARAFKEDTMRQPHVDDFVRLTKDIPELALSRGEIGVVRSTWFAPTVAYEVEFDFSDAMHAKRALLLERQVTIEDMLFENNVDLPA